MAAAGTGLFCGFAGSAAAGVAEFLGGRAFLPVAYALFMVLVGFTACAGVEGRGFLFSAGLYGIAGYGMGIFGHVFTNRTVAVRYLLICA